MKKVIILLAEGFEEIEAITPMDILNRGEIKVISAGIGGKVIKGSNGISISCDILIEEVELDFDCLILPGGLRGANNLKKSEVVNKLIKKAYQMGTLIGAICAAPAVVLQPLGLLKNHEVTCYPGFEKRFDNSVRYSEKAVVISDTIITARGPGKAFLFSLELLRYLSSDDVVERVASTSLYV